MKMYLGLFSVLLLFVWSTCDAQELATPSPLQQYLEKSETHALAGNNARAYQTLSQARSHYDRPDITIEDQITIERTLGEYARRMADLGLARTHYQASIALVKQQKKPDPYQLYQTYTSLGTLSWYSSQLDSAAYFYEKAIEVVQSMSDTPINTLYRQALLNNNIAGVYSLQGRTSEAIRSMENCISLLTKFAGVDGYETEKQKAVPLKFEAIDNLAGAYKDIGNYSKAEQLLLHAYSQKQKHLAKDDPALFISQILLGQLYYTISEYKKALHLLDHGLQAIKRSGADYLFWAGDAYYTLALIHEKQAMNNKAINFYHKADSLYALAFDGTYDNIYLEFLHNRAKFQVKHGWCRPAQQRALQTMGYVSQAGNDQSLLPFYQLRNLTELSMSCGEFASAGQYAHQAMALIDRFVKKSETLADSIKTEGEKVRIMLLQAKISYAMLDVNTPNKLKAILRELEKAVDIVERKKSILTTQQDITALIVDYKDLTDFIKKLNFEIYEKTNNKAYLLQGIRAHETNIYTRLRSRMDYQHSLHFEGVPTHILSEETQRKNALYATLEGKPYAKNTHEHREEKDNWQFFLQKLEKEYPSYHRMRYADSNIDINKLSQQIPKDQTIVRYFMSEDKLYALLINRQKSIFITLDSEGIADHIQQLNDFQLRPSQIPRAAYEMYKAIWQPIERHLTSTRVIIIPDGILHYVSFDMLTPMPTASFAELANTCLLNKYAFSYNYSLLAINQPAKTQRMNGNFIAFTPIFSQQEKQRYLAAKGTDHTAMDNYYLALLPLPFSEQLAQKTRSKLGGSIFTNQNSTSKTFRSQAAFNRIIYLGTHAETNNEFPEFSRLIFSKDGVEDDNSVYLHDIYGYNLTSKIAVLTACETGKPGYLDGEGMVSMAHAFNYAGSESILAGLWKIDERSSTKIVEQFYDNLQQGLPKDEALQYAKIAYIKSAEGRALSPLYWAGLNIIGDTTPMDFEAHYNLWLYIAAIALLLLPITCVIIYVKRRKKLTKSQNNNISE